MCKGYNVARALFNHALWGYGASLSWYVKNMIIKKLNASKYFYSIIRKALNSVSGNSVYCKRIFVNFSNSKTQNDYDLFYGIGKINFYVTGYKSYGRWYVTIEGWDTYNFDEVRSFSKFSFGNLANDLGWIMQRIGMLVTYTWYINFYKVI